jgi:hypothetical protein
MNQDPGVPKTYGSGFRSGSVTSVIIPGLVCWRTRRWCGCLWVRTLCGQTRHTTSVLPQVALPNHERRRNQNGHCFSIDIWKFLNFFLNLNVLSIMVFFIDQCTVCGGGVGRTNLPGEEGGGDMRHRMAPLTVIVSLRSSRLIFKGLLHSLQF